MSLGASSYGSSACTIMLSMVEPEPEALPAPVEYVLSLGMQCYPALWFRRQKLRPFAGSFDWIFSAPQMIRHCVDDNFRSFLDPAQIEALVDGGHRARHRLYSSMLPPPAGRRTDQGLIFNHHLPLIPAHHLHFSRAAARLTAVLQSPGRKLLLMMSKQPLVLADVQALFLTLAGKGYTDFELLVIVLRCVCVENP